MSLSREELLAVYLNVQQVLSTKERRITLVGTAKNLRSCMKCRASLPEGSPIVNLGRADNRWLWVCLGCVPEDPYETPHLRGLLAVCCLCGTPFKGETGANDSYCTTCVDTMKAIKSRFAAGDPDGQGEWEWYQIRRMKWGPDTLDCSICGEGFVRVLKVTNTVWDDLEAEVRNQPCIKRIFQCDRGHRFALCFGLHMEEHDALCGGWDVCEGVTLAETWCWWHPVTTALNTEDDNEEEE